MLLSLSYSAILKRVNEISKQHTKVMDEWLREGAFVKFVGDNVDKQCNVRDISIGLALCHELHDGKYM